MSTNEMHERLKVAAMPGAANLPLMAAIENGLFAEQGLEIALTLTSASPAAFSGLASGEFDIVYSEFDQLVAFNAEMRAQEDAEESELRAFLGGTVADLSLVVASDVESYEDLKDRSLALNGLTSGYSFVLYEMLARAGLRQSDFKMVTVGAAAERWQAVSNGEHSGTLAVEPYASRARSAGFRVLGRSVEEIGPLQARISAARQSWMRDNTDLAGGYIRGFMAGLAWAMEPANRSAAAAFLTANLPEIDGDVVEPVLRSLLGTDTGFTPEAAMVDDGVETVLMLRGRYGGHASALGGREDHVDLAAYESVVGQPD